MTQWDEPKAFETLRWRTFALALAVFYGVLGGLLWLGWSIL